MRLWVAQVAAASLESVCSKKHPKIIMSQVDKIGLRFVCKTVAEHAVDHPIVGGKSKSGTETDEESQQSWPAVKNGKVVVKAI